jgi:trimeric autotransporter adhesin
MTTKINAVDNNTSIFKVDTVTGITSNLPLVLSNTTQSTDASTGALIIAGGVAISGNLYAGSFTAETLDVSDISLTSLTNTGVSVLQGLVSITNTTVSTNTTTGALTISGGLGVSGTTHMSQLKMPGTSTVEFGQGVTKASDAGNIVYQGYSSGLDIVGAGLIPGDRFVVLWDNVNVRQNLFVESSFGVTASTSTNTGALRVVGGAGITGAVFSGSLNTGATSITSLTNTGTSAFAGIVSVTNTTASTNTSTGALVVDGGIGVAKDSVMSKLRVESNTINAFSVSRESNGPVIFEINSTEPSISLYNPSTSSSPFMRQNHIFKNSANTDINAIQYYRQLTDNTPGLETAYEYVDIYNEGAPQRVYELFGNVINFIPDVIIYSLTNSTSTSTGALQVVGGVGIQGDLYSGSLHTSNAVITSLTNSGTSSLDGVVSVTNTTESTSTSTGALTVSGGLGVAGAISAGSLNVPSFSTGATSITSLTNTGVSSLAGVVSVSNTTASTNTSTGALTVSGGVGVAGAVNSGSLSSGATSITSLTNTGASTLAGVVSVTNTTESTSTSTGALVVSGGLGVSGAVNSGSISSGGATLASLTNAGVSSLAGVVSVTNTTESTSTSTGALVVSGGLGVAGVINSGSISSGGATLTSLTNTGVSSLAGAVSITNTSGSTNTSTGALVVSGGVGISGVLNSGTTTMTSLTNTGVSSFGGVVSMTNTTASTDTSTGALIVAGGLGVIGTISAGSLSVPSFSTGAMNITSLTNTGTSNLQGVVSITNTTASTNISTGALVVSGGVGVTGTAHITTVKIPGANILEFGQGASKEANAGTIGYQRFDPIINAGAGRSLDIVGAGTSVGTRDVRIWDNLRIEGGSASTSVTSGSLITAGLGVTLSATMTKLNIPSTNVIELGFGVAGKQVNAGQIGYQAFASVNSPGAPGALDLVGAGTSVATREVRIWNNLRIEGNQNSTNVTTGSFTSPGGIGIAGNFFSSGTINTLNTTVATNTASGALVVSGGAGIAGTLFSGGLNTSGTSNLAGIVSITDTTGSTNTATGALLVSGGVGVSGTLSSSSVSTGNATLTTNINATDSTTGTLIVAGGAGIAGNTFVGPLGSLNVQNTIDATDTSTGALRVSGGLGVAKTIQAHGVVSTNGTFTNATNTSLSVVNTLTVQGTNSTTNASTGAIVSSGGIAVSATQDAVSTTNGGSLTVAGGASIAKNVIIGNSLTVTGDLIVNGTTTTVNSTTVSISDNAIILNSGPINSGNDSGILNQRYQIDNDLGQGDVVSGGEIPAESYTLVSATSTTVVLSTSASASDGHYDNWWVKITSGAGEDQVRSITGYVGATRTATVSSAFTTTPSGGDTIELYNLSYSMMVWKEGQKEFVVGFTDYNNAGVADIVKYADLSVSKETVRSTVDSTSVATGALVVNGGVGIAKNLNVGQDISLFSGSNYVSLSAPATPSNITLTLPSSYPASTSALLSDASGNLYFSASVPSSGVGVIQSFTSTVNNVSSPANITGLVFANDTSFRLIISAVVSATTGLSELFELYGIYSQTSGWNMNYISKCGDASGIAFSITSGGQVQYTSGNYSGFTLLTFKYEFLNF